MSALGAISSMRATLRCGTPSAVALGVDSPAPSLQTVVVKVITLWGRSPYRSRCASLCELFFGACPNQQSTSAAFGAGA